MVKTIIAILTTLVLAVGIIPFLGIDTKISWTMYLGMPLIILAGSAGVTFITRRIEAIIGGVILTALWPVFVDVIKSVLTSL